MGVIHFILIKKLKSRGTVSCPTEFSQLASGLNLDVLGFAQAVQPKAEEAEKVKLNEV